MTPDALNNVLSYQVMGNPLLNYLIAAAIFCALFIGVPIIKQLVVSRLRRLAERTKTEWDDLLVGLLSQIGSLVYFTIAVYFASRTLQLPRSVEQLFHLLFVIVLTAKLIRMLERVLEALLKSWIGKTGPMDATRAVVLRNMTIMGRAVLWLGGALFILDNLGVNVTAFIAGLGVGGVAVALALQAILGDAFSSFAIFMDKPFEVGDFIIVGDLMGTVEYIGLKTTRVRSLGGEQLVFSNSDLTGSRIRNFKRMMERRVVFTLGVVYETPTEPLKRIPKMIEETIKEFKIARFDRAHFHSFGDFALIFEVVYYVLSPDYNTYMDVQQGINLRIREEFERAGIEFAYPTQQLYVTKRDEA